jgi:hypothetical protein
MELPAEVWAYIISYVSPADYIRVGMINGTCRGLLTDQWFVGKWVRRHPLGAWEAPVLTALMIHMGDTHAHPTIDALIGVVRDITAMPLAYLCKIVYGPHCKQKFRIYEGFITPWPHHRSTRLKRTHEYASDGWMEIVVLEDGHAVVARDCVGGRGCLHKIVNVPRARDRGIIFPKDTTGVLVHCGFIAALDGRDPRIRDKHINEMP